MIENRNLVNYVNWFRKKAGLTAADRTVLTSSFGFDLGYTTVFPSLLSGSRLHMVSKQIYLFVEDLLNYIGTHQITYLKLSPSLFGGIVENPEFVLKNIDVCGWWY